LLKYQSISNPENMLARLCRTAFPSSSRDSRQSQFAMSLANKKIFLSLPLQFGIFDITGVEKFGDDSFADHDAAAEDARDELKFDLALLNADLKKLDTDWDFTNIIRPLLSDQGPANAVVPKLKKQIQRMTKIKEDFLRREEEKKQAGAPVLQEEERNQADALTEPESSNKSSKKIIGAERRNYRILSREDRRPIQ
jgi:hypothetical protein